MPPAYTSEPVTATARTELFDCARFPAPVEQPNLNYLLSEDADHRFALYLSTGRPGRVTPPHDHTTWAVIVGLDGVEENRLYERLDDRATPGRAEVRESGRRLVGPGDGIAFLADDIHSVHVVGAAATRHFHLYGLSLEHLPGRQQYDLASGTCKVFPASPGIVRC